MEREELKKQYNNYIKEIAQDALNKKPVNSTLLEVIAKTQAKIRDLDIIAAMKEIKQNTAEIPPMPSIENTELPEGCSFNECGECIRKDTDTPKSR